VEFTTQIITSFTYFYREFAENFVQMLQATRLMQHVIDQCLQCFERKFYLMMLERFSDGTYLVIVEGNAEREQIS